MKFWVALGGCLLALCGSAQATTISSESTARFPFQKWVSEAKVPTPDVTLTVEADTSQCVGDTVACVDPGVGKIYVSPSWLETGGGWLVRLGFLHEMGHAYLYWIGGDWRNEQLAQSYSLCALGIARLREVFVLRNIKPPGTRQVCYRLRRGIALTSL